MNDNYLLAYIILLMYYKIIYNLKIIQWANASHAMDVETQKDVVAIRIISSSLILTKIIQMS